MGEGGRRGLRVDITTKNKEEKLGRKLHKLKYSKNPIEGTYPLRTFFTTSMTLYAKFTKKTQIPPGPPTAPHPWISTSVLLCLSASIIEIKKPQ